MAGGDEAALSELYNRYRLILFGLLLRILHSRAEAEDCLQEVFLQVWRQAAAFDEARGRPFTWLVTMARSRAIDRLRALSSRDRTAQDAARATVEETSDAVTDAIRSEQAAVVRKALDALPAEQRRVLELAYFDGLTQSEIAARLNQPLGTIKTRTRTAMMKLRELLGGEIKNLS